MNRVELRVLHVINGLGTGGAERSLVELLPLLDGEGISSRIVCLNERSEGVHRQVVRSGYPVSVIGKARLPATLRMRRAITQWKPDIVHTTIFDADVLGRIAAAGRPCKVMTSLVNTTYDGVRVADSRINPMKLAAARAADRVTARHLTDHFHAISAAVRDSAIAHLGLPPERITIIERGRDPDRLGEPSTARRAEVRHALGVPDDAEIILNVGRQEPQKGQTDLVEAIAMLAVSRPKLMLLQVGRQGKATDDLERAVAVHGVQSMTRFLGHRDDIGNLLAAADIFAFPSIYEGLGGSVLEAMAMRLPIIVTAVPALVDVVEAGRGAAIVPPRDPSALANAMSHLLDNPGEATRVAAGAFQIFFERFTLERSAARMVDLYRDIAMAAPR